MAQSLPSMTPMGAENDEPHDTAHTAARETAVVIVVEAPQLDAVYRNSYPALATLGVPPHVTLLYPFVPPAELDAALPRLADVLARHERFEFALTELRTFPRTVWVAPEPATPFRELTHAIQRAFPRHPHWGGRFAEVIPHMTLVDGVDEAALRSTLERLRLRVEPLLPLNLTADEATVLAEQEDGRWAVAARAALGPASAGAPRP